VEEEGAGVVVLTNVINISLLELDTSFLIVGSSLVLRSFVDLEVRLELAVRLQITRLVGGVFVDDIRSVVLEVSQRQENDITRNDPDLTVSADPMILPWQARQKACKEYRCAERRSTCLFTHLTSDLTQPGLSVLALGLYPSVSKHLDDLSVFCESASAIVLWRQVGFKGKFAPPKWTNTLGAADGGCRSTYLDHPL
jgi:hypothetical protein